LRIHLGGEMEGRVKGNPVISSAEGKARSIKEKTMALKKGTVSGSEKKKESGQKRWYFLTGITVGRGPEKGSRDSQDEKGAPGQKHSCLSSMGRKPGGVLAKKARSRFPKHKLAWSQDEKACIFNIERGLGKAKENLLAGFRGCCLQSNRILEENDRSLWGERGKVSFSPGGRRGPREKPLWGSP